jgi:hypothetical protein
VVSRNNNRKDNAVKILRTQNEVETATMEEMVHTFNAMRGEARESFPSIEVARTQTRMAILSAQHEAGKAGVPKGATPVAKTVAELGFNPYQPGTLSHRLHSEIMDQTPIDPRPKKAELPKEERANVKRLIITAVRATHAGKSRPQAGSTRAQVLKFIQDSPESTCTVAALEEHFKLPVRGFLQKLLEKEHIVVIE